jgi:hypothetical protein
MNQQEWPKFSIVKEDAKEWLKSHIGKSVFIDPNFKRRNDVLDYLLDLIKKDEENS